MLYFQGVLSSYSSNQVFFSVKVIVWAPKSLQMVITAMKLKDACSLEGKL